MYLGAESWPDLETYFAEESLALVPVGSTEQHGPHLPEGTDHLIAESLARTAASQSGYLCTPTVNIGVSSHHRQFHGTMWVDPPAFREYMESLARNLTSHGIDRIIFVNAHGGNIEHLREVGRRLHKDGTAYAIEWMWDQSIPDLVDDLFEVNGPHGGPKETAMIMHINNALVHENRLTDARDNGLVDWGPKTGRQFGARTFFDSIENTDCGVLGDQTDATPQKGEELFEAATEQLCKLSEWLAEQDDEELLPHEHV
ncbi:creatininase family protein [Halovenus rubra]|uniref:Creatininase family protein n=2 Tax=Halovenus rubra TaxID=869890 RepID=A0ABD5XAU5_9EURY|nr:creatininase family protein [Halovenus rubra]